MLWPPRLKPGALQGIGIGGRRLWKVPLPMPVLGGFVVTIPGQRAQTTPGGRDERNAIRSMSNASMPGLIEESRVARSATKLGALVGNWRH